MHTHKAFMSYTQFDNENEGGHLSDFCERLSREVQSQTGEEFSIVPNIEGVQWGQNVQERIAETIQEATFLIPIITPSFFKNEYCRNEVQQFIQREQQLGRNDLVLPVYYIKCKELEDKARQAQDPLAQKIADHQPADWRELRFKDFDSPLIREKLAEMAEHISEAIERLPEKPGSTGIVTIAPVTSNILDQAKKKTRPVRGVSVAMQKRARALFTGRQEETEQFRRIVQMLKTVPAEQEDASSMFNVHGQGGIGKTTLLKEFEAICQDEDVLCIYIDAKRESGESIAGVIELMMGIRSRFPQKSAQHVAGANPFDAFDEAYQRYKRLKEQVQYKKDRDSALKEELSTGSSAGSFVSTAVHSASGKGDDITIVREDRAQPGTQVVIRLTAKTYPEWLINMLGNKGEIELLRGEPEQAQHCYTQALELSKSHEYDDLEALALAGFGNYHERLGSYQAAVQHFEQAIELHQTFDAPVELAQAQIGLSRVRWREGKVDTAQQIINDALSMLDDRQRLRDKALLQKELGAFFKEVGETALAHEHLAAAKELFDQWGIAYQSQRVAGLMG